MNITVQHICRYDWDDSWEARIELSDGKFVGCIDGARATAVANAIELYDQIGGPPAEPERETLPLSPVSRSVAVDQRHIEMLLRRAVDEGLWVELVYEDADGKRTTRSVLPVKVDGAKRVWAEDTIYCTARTQNDELRTFRLDRMQRVSL